MTPRSLLSFCNLVYSMCARLRLRRVIIIGRLEEFDILGNEIGHEQDLDLVVSMLGDKLSGCLVQQAVDDCYGDVGILLLRSNTQGDVRCGRRQV